MGTPRKRKFKKYLAYALAMLILPVSARAVFIFLTPSVSEAPNTVAEAIQRDRINIVLIGVGGDKHPSGGKKLADAIMVVSLKPSTRQIALISIPRDYYVPMGAHGMQRVNAAHALGDGYPGGGPGLLMTSVEKILGQPMNAYVRVDFAAFEKIIDELGGIDLYVYRPFHDFLFDDGFEQGWQHMDGKRALQFARYRYIKSEEGNNYARELRQQQVLAAIRDKLREVPPQQALRLVGVARAVSKHTSTNLTIRQMIDLYSLYGSTDKDQIRHVSLAPFTRAIKTNNPADPTPAVGPRAGDNWQIRAMARTVFRDTTPIVTKSQIPLHEVPPPDAGLGSGQ